MKNQKKNKNKQSLTFTILIAWKLCRLPKSVVLDRGPQLTAKLTKKLNKILKIEIKLLTLFYPQTNG